MENIRKTKGIPDTVDKHVGKQLRSRRTLLGLSQEKLAEFIGVTFQQVQKYERGTNRVSASRLYSFSKILDVSIDYFYEGLERATSNSNTAVGMSDNSQESFGETAPDKIATNIPEDIFSKKETLDLIRTYYSIEDKKTRMDILKFIKSMVKNAG